MSYLFTQIFPALNTLKILGNVDAFKKWIYNEYAIENSQQILDGYVFAIGCCLNTFTEGLANDYQLQIENDFLFERALHQILPLHKIESSCEKNVLLKKINPYIKNITKSKSDVELSNALDCFQTDIANRFNQLYADTITINSKTGAAKLIISKLSLINFAHTYLVQINNNGPAANALTPLSPNWIN